MNYVANAQDEEMLSCNNDRDLAWQGTFDSNLKQKNLSQNPFIHNIKSMDYNENQKS